MVAYILADVPFALRLPYEILGIMDALAGAFGNYAG
jgi:hypothetical protein